MILCSQAKLENDNKSINVKRGMKTKCEMGLRPCIAPTGYLSEKRLDKKGHVIIDPDRAPIIKEMFEKVANEGWSGRRLFHWLRFDLNFRTKSDKHLSLSNIYTILQNTFYYGVFEYPVKSGNWYTGQHEPLISKELFDKVREKMSTDRQVRSEIKEFAFTKLISCGKCGSGITAQEKFKPLKDGTTARYVYYGCTRAKNLNCKASYIREEELIVQLSGIIDQADINELGIKQQLEDEIERYRKFRKGVLGLQEKTNLHDVELRNYAKYVLKEGSITEKRTLLASLKSKILLTNKTITIT